MYPTENRITRTAGKCLTDCVLEFGLTVKLLSDQDPTDQIDLFQELLTNFRIKKVKASGYWQQTNGLTKQSKATVKQYFTIFLDQNNETTGIFCSNDFARHITQV